MEDVVPSTGLGDVFAEEDDVIAPADRVGAAGATESKGPKLRFCPESNDILYPREDKQRRVLVYGCLSCSYEVRPTEVEQHCNSIPVRLTHMHLTELKKIPLSPGGCRSTEQRVWWMVRVQK